MSGVRVRPYDAKDRETCLSVFESNLPRFFVETERADFAAYLDDLSGPYLVLEDADGRVVACGGWAVAAGGDTADLCWGMVRSELHGQGLGRLLTEARIHAVRAVGDVEVVALETSQHTTGFYERLGFTLRDVEEDQYAPGLHRCRMHMSL